MIGPEVERPSSDGNGAVEIRPRAGLSPKTPQQEAGILIEPPPSVPCASGRRPAASAAAAPPLDPPGVRLGVPGISGVPVQLRFRERDRPELRGVRLAEDDEAGLAQPPDDGGIEVRNVVGERAARVRRADVLRRGQVLDRDRDATERGVAPRSVGGSRILERLFATHGDEGVQLGIEPFDPIEVELGELERRDLLVSDQPCLLGRREERELGVGDHGDRSGEGRT